MTGLIFLGQCKFGCTHLIPTFVNPNIFLTPNIDWQINLTSSRDRFKLFYISQCYDRPMPQFMPKCHRVHIEWEGQCEQGKLANA